ncbi:MAG: ferrous iron transport protein B [Thiotrichales bacterium]
MNASTAAGNLILVGQPNVGKSALFHRLTGHYVMVSNYPGTTVEISRASARAPIGGFVIDTPGVVTLPPYSDEERVTARLLLRESIEALVQVGDAKSLRRTLQLSVQLAEMGLPMVLALNMMDEARALGLAVDAAALSSRLGVPVVMTVATAGEGIEQLVASLATAQPTRLDLSYPDPVEMAIAQLIPQLPPTARAPRSLALAFLSEDAETEHWLAETLAADAFAQLTAARATLASATAMPFAELIHDTRAALIAELLEAALLRTGPSSHRLGARLGRFAAHPLWGWPILLGVLYLMYLFVGIFGAGTLVGLLEEGLFGEVINPWVANAAERWLPPLLADFIAGDYGLWTMGATYAIALILPIVTTFFLAFGLLEDSGYFSRLVALSNRVFERLGLNGKAVLPMVLGLGCVTMATLTTRILESRRDRIILTFLLALAVPCSAQLGVVMGLLAGMSFTATVIWALSVVGMLGVVGWLASRLMPGESTPLMVELAPMRVPQVTNVITKTLARLEWYLKEVIPLFLLGTALMFALDKLGALPWLIEAAKPLVTGWLGLPQEAASAFLMGFLRRDFGATGLFVLSTENLLSARQMVVGMVTITLFVPCIASMFMIIKEYGLRIAVLMIALIMPLAFVVGGALNQFLTLLGWG